eukprot:1151789-Pelagomonas_calceolata.AAC.2
MEVVSNLAKTEQKMLMLTSTTNRAAASSYLTTKEQAVAEWVSCAKTKSTQGAQQREASRCMRRATKCNKERSAMKQYNRLQGESS